MTSIRDLQAKLNAARVQKTGAALSGAPRVAVRPRGVGPTSPSPFRKFNARTNVGLRDRLLVNAQVLLDAAAKFDALAARGVPPDNIGFMGEEVAALFAAAERVAQLENEFAPLGGESRRGLGVSALAQGDGGQNWPWEDGVTYQHTFSDGSIFRKHEDGRWSNHDPKSGDTIILGFKSPNPNRRPVSVSGEDARPETLRDNGDGTSTYESTDGVSRTVANDTGATVFTSYRRKETDGSTTEVREYEDVIVERYDVGHALDPGRPDVGAGDFGYPDFSAAFSGLRTPRSRRREGGDPTPHVDRDAIASGRPRTPSRPQTAGRLQYPVRPSGLGEDEDPSPLFRKDLRPRDFGRVDPVAPTSDSADEAPALAPRPRRGGAPGVA